MPLLRITIEIDCTVTLTFTLAQWQQKCTDKLKTQQQISASVSKIERIKQKKIIG
jgi:hypothetical protein